MNDLLASVRQSFARRGGGQHRPDVEMGGSSTGRSITVFQDGSGNSKIPAWQSSFFKDVDSINSDIAQVKALQQDISRMHDSSKALVRSKDVQLARQLMQERIQDVCSIAHKIKIKLETLDHENEASKRVKGQEEGTATERTRTSTTASLKKKLKDQMQEFTALRTTIQDEYRHVVKGRVYAITGQDVPEDEVDQMIESGQAETIFQRAVQADLRDRASVLGTLAEIEERHKGVKQLEQSLRDLHQIFLDMALLVEEQGGHIDQIDKHVVKASEYVADATVHLETAKTHQTNSRKCKLWLTLIIVIAIIIILLAVVLSVKPWQ